MFMGHHSVVCTERARVKPDKTRFSLTQSVSENQFIVKRGDTAVGHMWVNSTIYQAHFIAFSQLGLY